MSCECEVCGEHVVDCKCFNREILAQIETKIERIYEKYKNYPYEMINALEHFINVLDDDIFDAMEEMRDSTSSLRDQSVWYDELV